jgi:hypothetical protein
VLTRVLWLVLAGSLAASCQERTTAADDELPPRYARSFLPRDSAWIPEREIPSTPQSEPDMVIWELDESPSSEGIAEEVSADAFVIASWAAAKRHGWFDFQRGRSDGYHLLQGDRRHYYNEEYLFDDVILDPDRPEFLMYYGTPKGQKLAGLMFYTRSIEERGPQIGGSLTRWHFHVWATPKCIVGGLLPLGRADEETGCERGVPGHRSPEMLHVWFLEHPEGPFATSMWLRPDQLRALIARDERRSED